MREQIITSLLDNDLYKFNMGQCLLHQYADANVVWQYKNRDAETRKFSPEMVEEIKEQVKAFCALQFSKEELDYLSTSCPWLSKDYISFLSIYHPQYDWFDIKLDDNDQLYLTVSGPQFLTTYCERDASKLLVYQHGEVSEDVFTSLPKYLPQGALMVFNNTKVIQARLHFRKASADSHVLGALIEVFCLEPAVPNDYQLNFSQRGAVQCFCLVGNLKKCK